MSLLGKIKKNEVALTLEDYTLLLLGEPKSGKTSLFANLVEEFYQDSTKGLLIPFEKGYRAINNVQVFPHTIMDDMIIDGSTEYGWDVFCDLVQELVETKEENGIKILCIDTIDEFLEVASTAVMRASFKHNGKISKSLNDAFGGYGNGAKKLGQMVKEQVERLKNAGYGIVFTGHTKYKTIKTKMTDDEYSVLGSNLNENLFAIIANSVDIIAMITIERDIVDKEIVSQERYIRFRGDGFYVAGSRFANFPEKIHYGAKEFKEAYVTAIKGASNLDGKALIEKQAEQEKENAKVGAEVNKALEAKKEYKVKVITTLKEVCKENKWGAKLKAFSDKHDISFKVPEDLSDEIIDLIVNEFGLKI